MVFELHLVSILELKKARYPESPEQEIQTGLNCGYDGLSEAILSFILSSTTSDYVWCFILIKTITLYSSSYEKNVLPTMSGACFPEVSSSDLAYYIGLFIKRTGNTIT